MKKKALLLLSILWSLTLAAQESEELKSQNLVRGAYKTFGEFLLNKPSIVDSFYIDSKERTNEAWAETFSLMPRYYQTGRKIKNIWGFCDGDKTYIFHQSEYFPIVKENEDYTFIGYDLIDNSGVGVAGLLGGAIGGGIYAATVIKRAKSKKVKYIINNSTGIPIYPNNLLDSFRSGKKLIIYRKASKELDKPFEFLINDSLKYSFIPNSFVELEFDMPSVRVCFGADFKDCLVIELSNEEYKYVKCSLHEKDQISKLFEVSNSKGEYDSYKSEKSQKKRGKQAATILTE